jgi:hypothetical protein
MPDEPKAEDVLSPAVRDRSTRRGDVPEAVARRYFTDGRGGDGLGFYVDARVQMPAFRDNGRELVANRADPNAIRDMVSIAHHREWTIVIARGSPDFRREAWLAGRTVGLEVRGYRATERDLQELQRRQVALQRAEDRREVREERREARHEHRQDERAARQLDPLEHRLRIVDTVVRERVADPERQAKILASARSRIADWLERGAQLDDLRRQDLQRERRR